MQYGDGAFIAQANPFISAFFVGKCQSEPHSHSIIDKLDIITKIFSCNTADICITGHKYKSKPIDHNIVGVGEESPTTNKRNMPNI